MTTATRAALLALGMLCLSTGCPDSDRDQPPGGTAAEQAPTPAQPTTVRLQDGGTRPAPTMERAAGANGPTLEAADGQPQREAPVQQEPEVSDEVERATE